MKKTIFLFIVILSVCFTPMMSISAAESEVDLKVETVERMAVFKLLVDEKLMLTFLSHPKTAEFFLKEKRRKELYFLAMRPQIELLKQRFPSSHAINGAIEWFFSEIDRIENPHPYEELVMPFLSCGIASLYEVTDEATRKKIQSFQIGLFKNYLSWMGIGYPGLDLTKTIRDFSKNCSLPVFSQLLFPLLQEILESEGLIGNITDFYDSDSRVRLTESQQSELKNGWKRLPYVSSEMPDLEMPEIELGEIHWEEIFEELLPCGEKCTCLCILETLDQDIKNQHFFSLEGFIEVFFEVMLESYPEHREYFLNIQYASKGKNV